MATIRLFNKVSLPLVLSAALFVGCGSDDSSTDDPNAGGSAGTSGGSAGTAGTAGKGGSAGTTGGTAGTGGTTGGTAGTAGTAGTTGGTAGAGGTTGGTAGAGGDGGTAGAGGAATVDVRVAHLSPDAPAIDVCVVTTASATPVGPLYATLSGGLTYGQVTSYAPYTIDGLSKVLLVEPGKGNCDTVIKEFAVAATDVPAGATALTVAAVGSAAADAPDADKLALRFFADDTSDPGAKARVHFLHTATGAPAVDVKTVAADKTLGDLFTNVAFGADTKADIDPVENVSLAVGANPFTDLTAAVLRLKPVSFETGSSTSVFAIGKVGDVPQPLAALACDNKAAPVNGLSVCSTLERLGAQVRVAHLSTDAPAVNVCVQYKDQTTFAGPIISATLPDDGGTGLAFGQVSAFTEVPAGAVAKIRLIDAKATDCATGLVPDFDFTGTLEPGESYTFAATGETKAGSTTPLAVNAYPTVRSAPAGKIHVDFIHAAVGAPAVDVGLIVEGTVALKPFENVAFGDPGTSFENDPVASVTLAVGANPFSDPKAALLTLKPTSIEADKALTVFAIGNASDFPQALAALACDETAPPVGGLSACAILPELNAQLRFAHLSTNLSTFHACVSRDGTNFYGPLLNEELPNGLGLDKVSQFVDAPVGALTTLRLVNAQATDCEKSNAVAPTDLTLAANSSLLAGQSYSIAVHGVLGAANANGLRAGFNLEDLTVDPTKVGLTLVNAVSTNAGIDLATINGTTAAPIISGVAAGTASAQLETAPLSNANLAIGPSPFLLAASAFATFAPVSYNAGSVVTLFANGAPTASPSKANGVISCLNNQAPIAGLSICQVLPLK